VFTVQDNILYCYENIHDSILGYFDRNNSKIIFNDYVNYLNTYNKFDTFISNNGEPIMIDNTSSIYRIYLRNNYRISNEVIKYIHDYNDVGNICALFNFHNVSRKTKI